MVSDASYCYANKGAFKAKPGCLLLSFWFLRLKLLATANKQTNRRQAPQKPIL